MSGKTVLYDGDIAEIVRHLDAMGGDSTVKVVWLDYSGRGMNGETCLGFLVTSPHQFMFQLGKLLGSDALDHGIVEALEEFDVRTDDAGQDKIVYFPTVVVKVVRSGEE